MKINEHNSHLASTGKIEPDASVYKITTGVIKTRANWSVILRRMLYSSFQLGKHMSTAEDAEGRRGWLIVLKLCVPLRPLRLAILFIQAKYAVILAGCVYLGISTQARLSRAWDGSGHTLAANYFSSIVFPELSG
jgi:hypothetical protein